MQGIGEIERTSPEKNVSLDPEGETASRRAWGEGRVCGMERKEKEEKKKRRGEEKVEGKLSSVGGQSRTAPDPWMASAFLIYIYNLFQPHLHSPSTTTTTTTTTTTATTPLLLLRRITQSVKCPNFISLSKARHFVQSRSLLLPPPTMDLYQDPQVEEILLRFQNLRSKPARRAVYVIVASSSSSIHLN